MVPLPARKPSSASKQEVRGKLPNSTINKYSSRNRSTSYYTEHRVTDCVSQLPITVTKQLGQGEIYKEKRFLLDQSSRDAVHGHLSLLTGDYGSTEHHHGRMWEKKPAYFMVNRK